MTFSRPALLLVLSAAATAAAAAPRSGPAAAVADGEAEAESGVRGSAPAESIAQRRLGRKWEKESISSSKSSKSKKRGKSRSKSGKSDIFSHSVSGKSGSGPDDGGSETMDEIRRRGRLFCGIYPSPGFSQRNPDTKEWEGMDVSLCQAMAAALLGNHNKVRYTVVESSERFVGLANKDLDMLARTTTMTIARDVNEPTTGEAFSFSTPYFYTGLGFGGIPPYGKCADALDTSGQCADLKICVTDETTSIAAVRKLFAENYIVPLTTDERDKGLVDGICNAIASDQSLVSEFAVKENGIYTGPYEAGTNIFSKDPLAMVSRQDDPVWSDFLFWVLQALIAAEEQGITQGRGGEFPKDFDGFMKYGVDKNLFQRAINAVGNYGEIYEKYLEAIIPRNGTMNALNDENCPQQYALF